MHGDDVAVAVHPVDTGNTTSAMTTAVTLAVTAHLEVTTDILLVPLGQGFPLGVEDVDRGLRLGHVVVIFAATFTAVRQRSVLHDPE